MSTILVSLHDVYKYDVKSPYHVNIEKGDFILIKGHNGSGKTTLIKLILDFIKPDKGVIERQKLKIAYLPEKSKLPFFMKAHIYIQMYEKMKKCDIEPELLHLFNVPLFKYVHQLSKGNQQKLALVITLMGSPDLIIMDEPFSGLDPKSIEQLICYMKQLHQKSMTFIVSSHQPHLLEGLCTKVVSL